MKGLLKQFFWLSLLAALSGCGPTKLFYYPNKLLYFEPAEFNIPYTILEYPSLNGNQLKGTLFKTDQSPLGTIVHFHGNFGNLSNHISQSYYLTQYGFDVMLFDYQGFGGSEGKPTPQNTIEDGIATVRYAQEHLRNPEGKVGILGQSIGASVAIVVAVQERTVKAVVAESPFTSYRSIARHAISRSLLLWPVYPFYPLFISKDHDPKAFIEDVSPTPILFIHGDKDKIIPVKMSEKLFALANEPKEIWIISGARHLGNYRRMRKTYEVRISSFFREAFASVSKSSD